MTFFSLVLFLHLVSALLMFAALAVEAIALNRMRGALTSEEVRRWLNVAFGRPAVLNRLIVVLLLSGGHLAEQTFMWRLAWPKLAVLALVFVSVLGAITGRRMRAIRQSLSARECTETELFSQIHDPWLRSCWSRIVRAQGGRIP